MTGQCLHHARDNADNAVCLARLKPVFRYFAEAPALCSGRCDNCCRQLKARRQDMSVAAAAVVDTLQTLAAADKRLPLTQLVDAWRKSQVSSSITSWQSVSLLDGAG